MKCVIKKLSTVIICLMLTNILLAGCDSENGSDGRDSVSTRSSSGPSSHKTSNIGIWDNDSDSLVFCDYEVEKDKYLLKKQGKNNVIMLASDIFPSCFQVPYSDYEYPDLNVDGESIQAAWQTNEGAYLDVRMTEGQTEAVVNGETVDFGIAPFRKNDVLYIPADPFIELLEMEKTYDRNLKTLFVERKEAFPADTLLGKWSSIDTNLFVGVKDLVTGNVSLPSFASAYSFNKDGTFRMILISVGSMYDAAIEQSGKYKLIGNAIVFYDIRETLYEGSPFELVHQNQSLDDPSYDLIHDYQPDDNGIKLFEWVYKTDG